MAKDGLCTVSSSLIIWREGVCRCHRVTLSAFVTLAGLKREGSVSAENMEGITMSKDELANRMRGNDFNSHG